MSLGWGGRDSDTPTFWGWEPSPEQKSAFEAWEGLEDEFVRQLEKLTREHGVNQLPEPVFIQVIGEILGLPEGHPGTRFCYRNFLDFRQNACVPDPEAPYGARIVSAIQWVSRHETGNVAMVRWNASLLPFTRSRGK